MAAAVSGHADAVSVLLERASHPDVVNQVRLIVAGGACDDCDGRAADRQEGWSALHMAADHAHLECVQRLLAAGASVNLQTKVLVCWRCYHRRRWLTLALRLRVVAEGCDRAASRGTSAKSTHCGELAEGWGGHDDRH
jgi:hypothetical protein